MVNDPSDISLLHPVLGRVIIPQTQHHLRSGLAVWAPCPASHNNLHTEICFCTLHTQTFDF